MRSLYTVRLLPLVAALACAAPDAPTPVPIEVPHFSADDPLVQTAGFVGQTLRLDETVEDTRYILMAFRVGDVVTLGAMVEGPYDGDVEWRIDGARVGLPLREESPGAESAAEVVDAPEGTGPLVGQRAGFRGFRWINVDLEATKWMPADSAEVSLTFFPAQGGKIQLPADGGRYEIGFVPR